MKVIVDSLGGKEIDNLPDYLGPQDIDFYIRKEFGINEEQGTLHQWHIAEEEENDQQNNRPLPNQVRSRRNNSRETRNGDV